jgi:hypothetical protein
MNKLQLKIICVLVVMLSNSTIAMSQQLNSTPWYIAASVGQVKGDVSVSDIKNELSNSGITATDIIIDNDRVGYSLNLGYKLSDNVALVAGYVDLNEVSVEIASGVTDPAKFIEQVSGIHPNSAYGFTLGGEYVFELTDRFNMITGIGLYTWKGDFSSSEIINGALSASDDASGIDLYYGVSGEYKITKPLAVTLGWQQFNLDEDKADMWSIGIKYSL